MAKRLKRPVEIQTVFEARYERGYRYLDRCGDAMVILEEGLPSKCAGNIWMPAETKPSGARMKCPGLDLTLVFDSSRLCLDQNPVTKDCGFESIADFSLSTIVSKFGIDSFSRIGLRRIRMLSADSIDDADRMSVSEIPLESWPAKTVGDLAHKTHGATVLFETPDRKESLKLSIRSVSKIDAPQQLDERLRLPPHLLKSKQREALIEQQKRLKKRQTDPDAGLLVDLDYSWVRPEDLDIGTFFEKAEECISLLIEQTIGE